MDRKSITKRSSNTIIETFLPGSNIGIIGGGQLGRMSAMAAHHMGYNPIILAIKQESPYVCQTIIGSYTDEKILNQFIQTVDVVTTEFENIPLSTLKFLEKNKPIRPNSIIFSICQNRINEKLFLNKNGFKTVEWQILRKKNDIKNIQSFPSIIKTAESGYDGHGQYLLNSYNELIFYWNLLNQKPCIVERKISFLREISVIVARNEHNISVFPVCENEHKNHILHKTTIPANLSNWRAQEAQQIAISIAEKINLIGILCVEMFDTGNCFLINELAPRPHNSGHWTLDACVTSQFEQHIRSICNVHLGSTDITIPCVMYNLLGTDIKKDNIDLLKNPYCKMYIYGKKEITNNRKMGHITYLLPT